MVSSRSTTTDPSSPRTLAPWYGRPVLPDQIPKFLAALRSEIAADWVGLMEDDRVAAVATSPRHARAVPALATCPAWTDGTLRREPVFTWTVPGSRTGEHWIAVRIGRTDPTQGTIALPPNETAIDTAAGSIGWLLAIWKYRDGRAARPGGRVTVVSGVVCVDQTPAIDEFAPSTDPSLALILWAAGQIAAGEWNGSTAVAESSPSTTTDLDAVDLAGDLAALLELTGFLQSAPSIPVAIQLLAGHLRGYLNADEVWVSYRERGRRPQVASHDGPESNPSPALVDACEEALLRETMAVLPEASPADRIGCLALRTFARDIRSSQLLVKPISVAAVEASLVLMIVWREEAPDRLSHARRFLDAADGPVGSAVALQATARESLVHRWSRTMRESRRSRPVATTLLAALLFLIVLLLPVPDPVAARVQLEPLRRRFVAAPFDTRLAATLVAPGDVVTAGQTLARLDEKELLGELDQLAAAIHKSATERDGHLSQHEPGLAELDRLEMQRLTARHDLVEKRLRQLEVIAPIAGIVVAGDLDQSLGAPFKTGDVLFEIAPVDKLRAELLVVEADRALVRDGQLVDVHLDSLSAESFEGRILRIRPRAEERSDEYGFVAELELTDAAGRLRPGMHGLAQIDQPWRPLAVRLFRKPWQVWRVRLGL